MTDLPPPVFGAAAFETKKRSILLRACHRVAVWIPAFAIILLVYMAMETQTIDMRAPLGAGQYSLSMVEILDFLAFLAVTFELLKVSTPGKNETIPVLLMTVALIAYIIFALLGMVGVPAFRIFATSEFIVLTIMSAVQVGLGMWINAATLQRTIGTGVTN